MRQRSREEEQEESIAGALEEAKEERSIRDENVFQ